MALSKVAIVGRPNVGKSTLFNRLVGRRLALVDDEPGVTRDRREGEARLGDLRFVAVDTPGLEEAPEKALEGRMRRQTEKAIAESAVCLFVIDARAGLTPLDETFADLIRRQGKPAIVLANKAEGTAGEAGAVEAWSLGMGEPIAFSAEHGRGMDELYAALEPLLAAAEGDDETLADEEEGWDDPLKPLRIAVVGRPNAGKSTLVNRVLGEERVLAGPEAGITRDAVSVEWTWRGPDRDWPVKLYDTAGLRRKAKVVSKLEKLSVADALRAIRFAEVVALLLDAGQPFEKQDLQIADLVLREGRALVIAVNKWDLVEDKDARARDIRAEAERLLPQAPGVPIVFLSALTGRNIDRLMPAVVKVYVDWNARVKTPDLNEWLRAATERHPPPAVSGRRIRIKYIAQVKTRPPTFVAHCTRADELPASYRRYLVNGIREAFDIPAVPIRLMLKKPENPYSD
ncbi:ribosome biogenesis GTPase Der [Amphiplicatus metriothermophilus]|uniref:GTPase Der n=1 Tax=Amphiplicatus metriothermophilus TaxID=1519374 RepID=A0A239PSU8_9PROT|nr:ribosome biogenesis GTPase Der [Amphiplicatus metriothermophilus]MBB5519171.1 GTP-binding protein [Amphiplicatus metriothermophilus]SNT73240.1 GTP-binding protein [Amphiplicatus metriothermophilus]